MSPLTRKYVNFNYLTILIMQLSSTSSDRGQSSPFNPYKRSQPFKRQEQKAPHLTIQIDHNQISRSYSQTRPTNTEALASSIDSRSNQSSNEPMSSIRQGRSCSPITRSPLSLLRGNATPTSGGGGSYFLELN